jgi:hypothetical protein
LIFENSFTMLVFCAQYELIRKDAKESITTFRPNLLDVPSMHTTRFLGAFGYRCAVHLIHLVGLDGSASLPAASPPFETVLDAIRDRNVKLMQWSHEESSFKSAMSVIKHMPAVVGAVPK